MHLSEKSRRASLSAASMVLNVHIGVIGPGLVGSAVIRQILSQASNLEPILGAAIKLVGVANSRHMLVCHDDLGSDVAWKQKLTEVWLDQPSTAVLPYYMHVTYHVCWYEVDNHVTMCPYKKWMYARIVPIQISSA